MSSSPPHGTPWVVIRHAPSERDCRELSLVLHASGIPCEIGNDAGEFTLSVPASLADRGRAELDAYNTENPASGPPPLEESQRSDGWSGVLAYGTILLLFAVLEQRRALGIDWFEAGKTHAGSIRRGHWWRAMTALTLHADLGHILANLIVGSLVGLFAGQSLGSGLGWFCILLAGSLGNFANAWLRPADHASVGASTAVFGAIGLMAADTWLRRRRQASRFERWTPIIGGVLLLGYLGTGGVRTDVAAHVWGFLGGAVLGALLGKFNRETISTPKAQFRFGLATLILLAAAWTLAALFSGTPSLLQYR